MLQISNKDNIVRLKSVKTQYRVVLWKELDVSFVYALSCKVGWFTVALWNRNLEIVRPDYPLFFYKQHFYKQAWLKLAKN